MSKRTAARSAPAPSKSPAETRRILHELYAQHPGADTELHFSNAYELLVATILSAQCTDERVNQVTPALFRRYPDARALARATTTELEPQIQSTGFFRAKSRSLIGMATAVVEQHGGEIPRTMEELVALPGVGRKTANVVLGHALGVPGLPVDRHVLRVSNRIGIARSEDPVVVEQQLCGVVPPADWTRTSDTLILHGRRICRPRPLCDRCAVREECDYYGAVVGFGLARKNKAGLKPAKVRRKPTAVRLKPNTTGAGRAPKAREPGRGGGGATARSESRLSSKASRAPKAREPGRGGGGATARSESRLSSKASRAPKARGQVAGVGLRPRGSETGSSSKVPRAPKARGTGRGGGAPRQTKK